MSRGLLAELLKIDCAVVLPLIRNRDEAEALLSVGLLGQQLDANVQSLIVCMEHERILLTLYETSVSSRNSYDVALVPALDRALELIRQRTPAIIGNASRLVGQLSSLETSIRQYGAQNLTLARELQRHAQDVADQKKALSRIELNLCDRMSAALSLAGEGSVSDIARLLATSRASIPAPTPAPDPEPAGAIVHHATASAEFPKNGSQRSSQTMCGDEENSQPTNSQA
jgi:hypothetical protein